MTAAMIGAPAGPTPPRRLMGVSAAAELLGKHKSTISRHVAAGKITNHADAGGDPLIDVDEAARELRLNIDPAKQRGASAALFGAGEPGVATPSAPPRQADASPPSRAHRPGGGSTTEPDVEDQWDDESDPLASGQGAAKDDSYVAESRRVKGLQGDLLARKLAEQDGLLVGKAGVEREFETLFQSLAERVSTAARGIAGQLATMTDEREIAQLLRQTLDQAMNDLSAEAAATPEVD